MVLGGHWWWLINLLRMLHHMGQAYLLNVSASDVSIMVDCMGQDELFIWLINPKWGLTHCCLWPIYRLLNDYWSIYDPFAVYWLHFAFNKPRVLWHLSGGLWVKDASFQRQRTHHNASPALTMLPGAVLTLSWTASPVDPGYRQIWLQLGRKKKTPEITRVFITKRSSKIYRSEKSTSHHWGWFLPPNFPRWPPLPRWCWEPPARGPSRSRCLNWALWPVGFAPAAFLGWAAQ